MRPGKLPVRSRALLPGKERGLVREMQGPRCASELLRQNYGTGEEAEAWGNDDSGGGDDIKSR